MGTSVTRTDAGWSNAAADRIELAAPDPAWRGQYEQEAAAVRSVLPKAFEGARLEHFGSTAVPNLRAKPIIDILLIHPGIETWPQLIDPLRSLGYVHWAENPRSDQMFFVKGMPPFGQRRTHHVHVRTPAGAEKELAFRDLLRSDAALAREYERLKDKLAQSHATDRDAYTDGKTAFVANVLRNNTV